MKQTGLFGKGSGKLGSAVFAISGGEQIVREYNPRVSNPNTEKQVEQRAKFKLLSQLAAVFAGAMAFVKKGLKSARNQFVSANFSNVAFSDGSATMDLTDIVISSGSRSLASLELVAGEGTDKNAKATALASDIPDACLFVCVKNSDLGKPQVILREIVMTPTNSNTFESSNLPETEDIVVYAVGLYLDANAKRSIYEQMGGEPTDLNVKLDVTEKAIASAYSTTSTSWVSA